MQNYYVRDIVKATGGTLLCGSPDTMVSTCSTDSNTVEQGGVFVPIIGARVDAHTFIDSAISNGACAVLTSEHDEMDSEIPYIRVSNTTMALQHMGREYGKRMVMPKIGVTGSVGKTTTKEMIATALSPGYRVFKTAGNFNSQIGMPLTLLRMTGEDQIAVIEMGIGMRGEMVRLAELVELDDAVVTNIGVSHIELLKTQDGIAEEKLHIEDAIKDPVGIVFLNGDDEVLKRHMDSLHHEVRTFGLDPKNDYFATNIHVSNNGMDFDINFKNKGTYRARLNVLGEHNVRNALVAVAVAERHGVNPRDSIAALKEYQPYNMRGQMIDLNGVTLIDDSYNASPDSMKAGLDVLCSVMAPGRRFAVLADMLELGENAPTYHKEVGEFAADKAIDELLLFGELAAHIGEGTKSSGKISVKQFETREAITEYLKENMQAGDVVYFKGSRGMKLNECVDALQK